MSASEKPKAKNHHRRQKLLDILGSHPEMTLKQAIRESGLPYGSVQAWRHRYPEFGDAVKALMDANQAAREKKPDFGGFIVLDPDRVRPKKPPFAEWRRRYIGRSVPTHQEPIVKAYEDKTNQRIFIFGPPGCGKDTTAGDMVLNAVCDDFAIRTAWIMKGESFSRRRLSERLAPSLTDPKSYRYAPAGHDSTTPSRSLIEDYGPYAWDKRMVWKDGSKVERTTWTKNEMYFVGSETLEADPNLWATGLGGALYGARVDLMVVSDPFDRENATGAAAEGYIEWFKGTMRSRLDDRGRLIVLGTRLARNDPYEKLMEYFIGNAQVIHEDGVYTKYNNGVATVIFPAIYHDDKGEEQSYWPAKFPLESAIEMPDGTRHDIVDLSNERYQELADDGGHYVQGLRQIREDDETLFETMYQQNPPVGIHGEFTDAILHHCEDVERTFGVSRPGTMLVLGVDPARSGGAAWVLWEWDKRAGTITMVDYFYGEKLGTAGIKERLILDPIRRYMPTYLVYETNREAAILDMDDIQKAIKEYSVTVRRSRTGANRGGSVAYEGSAQVSAMVFDMRNGTIRFPAGSVEDRKRLQLVRQQFHNWDEKQILRESGMGRWRHISDDLVMAAWVAWAEIQAMQDHGPVRSALRHVPEVVRRAWREHAPVREEPAGVAPTTDLRSLYFEDFNANN